MGTPEENRALVARFIDALGRGDVATAAACFDTDRYFSHAFEADLAGTWEQMKARHRTPVWTDVEGEQLALVADGDRVVLHRSFTGTQIGPFLGIAPTGARVAMHTLEIWRVDGDKIVEHWGGPVCTELVAARLRGETAAPEPSDP